MKSARIHVIRASFRQKTQIIFTQVYVLFVYSTNLTCFEFELNSKYTKAKTETMKCISALKEDLDADAGITKKDTNYIDRNTFKRPPFDWTVDQREKRKKTGAV